MNYTGLASSSIDIIQRKIYLEEGSHDILALPIAPKVSLSLGQVWLEWYNCNLLLLWRTTQLRPPVHSSDTAGGAVGR